MQAMMASLVTTMSVRDSAFKSGMAAARADAKRTEAQLERSSDGMANSFASAAHRINLTAVRMADGVSSSFQRVMTVGAALTAALTVPIALIGKGTKDSAAEFEQAINRVRAQSLGSSAAEIEKMRDTAMTLGPAMGRSAAETAGAMEMLAKNGLRVSSILNGALSASMTLATIGGAELSASADLTTDIMQQFGKRSAELPGVVDKVTGALDASKLSFDDYRLAIGQAGGVAGGLGYQFEEFNVALAATASLFASGSDAGTSFKTFLTSLTPASKESAELMKQYGLSFFDAEGNAKSLYDIAEMLRRQLGNLNDEAKTEVLQKIFGRDAMRTAIGLMQQGETGLRRIDDQINAINAQDKLTIVQEGDIAASERLSAAVNVLAIRMGEVLLPIATALKNAVASMINVLSSAPVGFFAVAAGAAGLLASIGPLIMALKVALPAALLLTVGRLGAVGMAAGLLLNPFGMVIRLLGQLALRAGAATAIGLLGARMVALAGPIGIIIGLLTVVLPLIAEFAARNEELAEEQERLSRSQSDGQEIMMQLATATRKAAERAREAAAAFRDQARAALVAARANMEKARTEATAAIARQERWEGIGAVPGWIAAWQTNQKVNEYKAFAEIFDGYAEQVAGLEGAIEGSRIASTTAGGASKGDGDAKSTNARKGRASSSRDIARDEAAYLDEVGRLRVGELRAIADLTESYRARYGAAIAELDEERAAYARNLALDEGLTDAKRAELMAAKDRQLFHERAIAEADMNRAEAQEAYDLFRAGNDAAQEMARHAADMAETADERRAAELDLLRLQRRQHEAQLDLVLATEATSSAAWSNAYAEKQRLDSMYAARQSRVLRDTEGPAAAYLRSINLSAAQIGEATEAIGASALERFNDTLADTATGFLKLGGIAGQFFNQLIADVLRLHLKQALLIPLASRLFGGGGADLGGMASSNIGGFLANYGGGKASGGRVSPRSWYMVGENGPEPFIPDSAGTIVPNSGLRKLGGGGAPVNFDLRGAVMTDDLLQQMNTIAAKTSGQMLVNREAGQARAMRRRLGR